MKKIVRVMLAAVLVVLTVCALLRCMEGRTGI